MSVHDAGTERLTDATAGTGFRTGRPDGPDTSRGAGGGRRRRRRGGRGEQPVVPDATFTSYYGRPVVKPSPWEADIPAYLFFGGVAGGSSLLAAGADLTGRPSLRRVARIGALGAISVSFAALVHDLGRPRRFVNMLRVAKPSSPMSVGTWILTLYGPFAGVAGAAELTGNALRRGWLPQRLRPVARLLHAAGRPAGMVAAGTGPAVAAYTAVLLADTATPSWHEAYRELPFVFVGSAGAAAGGLGLLAAHGGDTGPATRLAVAGTALEMLAEQRMERSMGLTAEPLHQGTAGRLMRASKVLGVLGAAGAAVSAAVPQLGRWLRRPAGAALLASSVCTRFGVFEAGQASARDPKYTVVPQRERLERSGRATT
ncbi:NrfD/PsrC family molybdoenzyme membrane anchor subunit [Nakamurella endophytica]|uniref:Polysulfide reductase n=1 Tax=Nakamurella endophytica TaxID=1748367 RepID=A0A917T0L1_9ACTN|nr:NrfD/PsrC family molybdoenzyme membrane anchor subunit [Nakamurella endophytica]GGM06234.1 polysulfide reductase [Nakamurella endophytica]